MSDVTDRKPDWSIGFVGKLCLIGWICAVMYEAFDSIKPIRQAFLLFGFWACVIALLNSLVLLFIRRQGIFLIFVLVTSLPTIHLGLVVKNIVVQKMAVASEASKSDVPVEANDSQDASKPNEVR